MELWLLNNLDTAALTAVVVGSAVVVAGVGSLLVRRRFPQVVEGEHNEVIGVVLGLFGAIYGIILAFVIVNLWTQMEETRTGVAREATAAATLVRDVQAFPPEPRERIDAALGAYLHAVVDVQWPLMREGRPDFEATAAKAQDIYDALQSYEPQSNTEQAYYDRAAEQLDDVVAERRARIAMATRQLPPLLQTLVYGGALVIIVLTALYGTRRIRVQVLFTGTIAALIGFSLLLVLVLDRPFTGDLCVSPAPFKEGALSVFWP